jgi:hypothetical protein
MTRSIVVIDGVFFLTLKMLLSAELSAKKNTGPLYRDFVAERVLDDNKATSCQ